MLYYEVVDNNKEKWIMFFHCVCGNRTMFYNEVSEYSKYYNLIFVDLPGHGKSMRYPLKFNYSEVIFDIVEILNELKIEKVNLVGLSFGAIVAAYFAYLKPNRIDKIVFDMVSINYSMSFIKKVFWMFNKFGFILPKRLYVNFFVYMMFPKYANLEFRKELIDNAMIMKKSHLLTWTKLICEYFDNFDNKFKYDLMNSTNQKLFIVRKSDTLFIDKSKNRLKNSLYNKIVKIEKNDINFDEKFLSITLNFFNNYQKYFRDSVYQKIS